MKKKDIWLLLGCIVIPGGAFVAGAYFGPKIKKRWEAKKEKELQKNGTAVNPNAIKPVMGDNNSLQQNG